MKRILCLAVSMILLYQTNGFTEANPNTQNRVHRESYVWMNITNWGYIGNDSYPGGMADPAYPGTWAPQCEFPGGSDVQYLFMGSLWIGALIQEGGFEFPRVSTGNEGWFNQNELFPGEGEENGIVERSYIPGSVNYLGQEIYSPEAVAAQEFIAIYSDTLTDPTWVSSDPVDGPHRPLGVMVTQKSMVWGAYGFDDFVLFEFTMKNIGDDTLKNPYLGFYIDADVGRIDETMWHTDDLADFLEEYAGETLNLGYIADNDGRPRQVGSGSDFTCPGVAGTYLLRSPDDIVYNSFNWWVSHGNPDFDFGPSWEDDEAPVIDTLIFGGDTTIFDPPVSWTTIFGTPVGDAWKYFLLGNKEHDFDQVYTDDISYIQSSPQQFTNPFTGSVETHDWKIEENLPNAEDIANGYDTRYLISWGPLGENLSPPGQEPETYLYPGDSLNLTLTYVCGDSFHDVNNPQPTNMTINPSLFVYDDLAYNLNLTKQFTTNYYYIT